jgi:hypothetical protein
MRVGQCPDQRFEGVDVGTDPERAVSYRFMVIDAAFLVAGAAAMVVWWRSASGWWSLFAASVLATIYVVYKFVRLMMEYRAGVSVRTGGMRRWDVNYARAVRPLAFWWAMGIEAGWLLVGAAVAVVLWVALASA